MREIEIRSASLDDCDTIAYALSRAFSDEPYVRALFGSGDICTKVHQMFSAHLAHHYLISGQVDIAYCDGQVAGAAVWNPPSASLPMRHWLELFYRYASVMRSRLPHALFSDRYAARFEPRFKHWYLYVIGVDPSYRGLGIGSRLLDYRIDQIGAHEACYLEASTPDSARLYARHGFLPLGEMPLNRSATLLGMWRPADQAMADFNGIRR